MNGALSGQHLTAMSHRVWMTGNPYFPKLACPSVVPELGGFPPTSGVYVSQLQLVLWRGLGWKEATVLVSLSWS